MARVTAPDWPAMMRRTWAAAYCCLTVAEFEREVAAGRISAPVIFGGAASWSRSRLDEDLGRILGSLSRVAALPDWRDHQPGLRDG
jgi:hypothetical protein